MNLENRVKEVLILLESLYPNAECTLDFQTPIQLLVATQLAAQCTDKRVNIVTQELFKRYKDVHDFANADLEQFEQDIRQTGFFRNKAKNIINASKMIISDFECQVPDDIDSMLKLSGVGRKTANVVLGVIYGVPGIVVDTHAKRISYRLGFTENTDPEKIEKDLMRIIPKNKWLKFCHQLVYHGRNLCKARKPLCGACPLIIYCPYGSSINK